MKYFRAAVLMLLCCMIVCLGLFPERCMGAVTDSLGLCVRSVIPALFPFFVCSSLLVSLGAADIGSRFLSGVMYPLFRTDGAGALAVVMGLISGYPIGADCAVRLYESGRINKDEAERLAAFCNNSGPLFIIGTVGLSLGGSAACGRALYLIHIISALISGMIIARIYKGASEVRCLTELHGSRTAGMASALGCAVTAGVKGILNVCGFIVFFSVLESTIPDFPGRYIFDSLLEITGGIRGISAQMQGVLRLPLISMFLAFSGLSVFFQVAGILAGSGLSLKPYIIGKLTQGAIAFALTALWMMLRGGASYTGAFAYDAAIYGSMGVKQYLILIGGETVWCLLTIGILALAAYLTPEE